MRARAVAFSSLGQEQIVCPEHDAHLAAALKPRAKSARQRLIARLCYIVVSFKTLAGRLPLQKYSARAADWPQVESLR